ncbi:CPXCG motif-containing cysteine-rich protein [Thaumasiovibrio subtropicus]|uniref:CPXCG motif-containing cysteine-rich protein n=1 Tax=Thaumasiovibrio subtropicus TaxID=1891207 RepID=UPI000B34C023|nr:CPXCG motif-containing cysteine-rich protein [Thaumasiovibrio subtropicus]
MNNFKDQSVTCPHCGYSIRMTLDASAGSQDFYDDCPSCCNAIHLHLTVNEAQRSIQLFVDADDEQIF